MASASPERPVNRDANSIWRGEGLERLVKAGDDGLYFGISLGLSARRAAILLLPIALAACAGSDEIKSITYTDDRGVANQPYPTNYRADILRS